MLLLVSVPSALAYFSTFTKVEGQRTLVLEYKTDIHEVIDKGVKKITISADEDSGDVYVRVKVYKPEDVTLSFAGEHWGDLQEDGFIYYDEILTPEKPTSTLEISVVDGPKEEYHIIVIYEAVPVSYNDDNTPYAEWEDFENKVSQEENQPVTPIDGSDASTEGGE